jgi:hypothetical protein
MAMTCSDGEDGGRQRRERTDSHMYVRCRGIRWAAVTHPYSLLGGFSSFIVGLLTNGTDAVTAEKSRSPRLQRISFPASKELQH